MNSEHTFDDATVYVFLTLSVSFLTVIRLNDYKCQIPDFLHIRFKNLVQ